MIENQLQSLIFNNYFLKSHHHSNVSKLNLRHPITNLLPFLSKWSLKVPIYFQFFLSNFQLLRLKLHNGYVHCTLPQDDVIPVKNSHVVKGIGMPRIDIQSHSQMMEGLFTIFQQGCQVVMSQNVLGPQPIVREHNDYWIISYEMHGYTLV